MNEIEINKIKGIKFGDNTKIFSQDCVIENEVVLGKNVTIKAKKIYIGKGTVIQDNTTISGLGSFMDELFIGDNCFIGFNNQILTPRFKILDYSQLHNSCLSSGYKELTIGYNCWIGQNSILNCTEKLEIQNNVRIGTQSQLWTHVASGELYEGCTLYGNKPLTLKNDVWIVGGAVISPGLILEEKSIIMTGSVLTKNTLPKHTYAGVPAIDVTDKLNFWKDILIEEKYSMVMNFIQEFLEKFPEYKGFVKVISDVSEIEYKELGIIISKCKIEEEIFKKSNATIFDLITKKYNKRRTKIEADWIRFNVGFRIRFTPNEN